MSSFLSDEELSTLGLRSLGDNVLVSRKASIYGAAHVSIGDDSRIDDFCILSGSVMIGSHVHVGAGTYLFGGSAGIVLEDCSCVSSRCAVYALSDDYHGNALANATIPLEYRLVSEARVTLGRHALVGSGCTILPGVTIGEGSSVGAMSLVRVSLDPWGVYAGVPCRKISERNQERMMALDARMRDDLRRRHADTGR